MHKDDSLYVSDYKKNEMKRWRKGERQGTIVAGGNEQDNQLDGPTYIFVDDDYALYVSDHYNHRVIKWLNDATEGIIVAGENGATQLCYPQDVIVDKFGRIYVVDWDNALA